MNDVEIIYDESGLTALWACQNLGDYSPLSGDFFTFAFRRKGKIIGALIFSGYRPDHDVWWTIYTTDRHLRRLLMTSTAAVLIFWSAAAMPNPSAWFNDWASKRRAYCVLSGKTGKMPIFLEC